MNHQTVEFLARDRIADMRKDADRLRNPDAERPARRPVQVVSVVGVRRLIARISALTAMHAPSR